MKISHILQESPQQCPECGGPAFGDLILAEKKDACYSKVRSRYKVWPSAYASGALVQCRKKGAANWGNKSEGMAESQLNELFDMQQEYFKLADGTPIRVEFRQAGLNADAIPGSINITPVDPKIMPMSGMQTIQPWDKARQNIRMAIQKWVQSGQAEPAVAEGLDQPKEAFQAIQKLQRFAQDNPDFTLQQLDNLPSRGNPIKPMFANANLAIDTLIQAYKTRKELGNAEFLKQLKDEINYFLTDRTASSDPTTLGDLLMHKLGKINFQQGVAEDDKKPHPETWHDVDPKLGKQVDRMSQAEKVRKGLAHPDTLKKDKKPGVAEGNRFDEPLTGYHIVYRNSGNPVSNTPSFETKDQAQKYLMTKMFANHQDFKVVHTANVGMAESIDDSPVTDAMFARLQQRPDLLRRYGVEYVIQAVHDLADSVGAVDEIGSSDVSGWVRQLEWNLKNKLNQYDEPMSDIDRLEEVHNEKIAGRHDPEEFDAMVSRLRQLAGSGPLKTVWDEKKRVYRNVPVAQQPNNNGSRTNA